MLRLRINTTSGLKTGLIADLGRIDGVYRVTAIRNEESDTWVVAADLEATAAEHVVAGLNESNVSDDDYVIVRQDVVSPRRDPGSTFHSDEGFAWVEVLGDARANSRPIARYIVLMLVAGWIAGLGVITDSSILIIGAMAVSPDLLPLCATCVALVGQRLKLAGQAFATLLIGMLLVMGVAGFIGFLLVLTGILDPDINDYLGGLGTLANTDYSTVMIALAAGVAAILSFETRAASTVGVAISVTTVPASAYFGVAVGLGQAGRATGALAVLAINLTLLVIAGTITLAIQRRLADG